MFYHVPCRNLTHKHRLDIFQRDNLTVPQTWEQFADLAERYHNGPDGLVGACIMPIGERMITSAGWRGVLGVARKGSVPTPVACACVKELGALRSDVLCAASRLRRDGGW